MTVFEVVRENVTARMAAEALGLQVNRNSMACCPFHDDRHPSMKLDERYYCFGCHASGDAIDFASSYLHLGKLEAAKRLADEFKLEYEKPQRRGSQRNDASRDKERRDHLQKKARIAFEAWLKKSLHVLYAYKEYQYLQREKAAPRTMDEPWSEAFIRALREQDVIEYLISLLEIGTLEQKTDLYINDRERIEDFERQLEHNQR